MFWRGSWRPRDSRSAPRASRSSSPSSGDGAVGIGARRAARAVPLGRGRHGLVQPANLRRVVPVGLRLLVPGAVRSSRPDARRRLRRDESGAPADGTEDRRSPFRSGRCGAAPCVRRRDAASPTLRYAALAALPGSLLHLFYFYPETRFHLFVLAFASVLGGAAAGSLAETAVRRKLWPVPIVDRPGRGLPAADSRRSAPSTHRRRDDGAGDTRRRRHHLRSRSRVPVALARARCVADHRSRLPDERVRRQAGGAAPHRTARSAAERPS